MARDKNDWRSLTQEQYPDVGTHAAFIPRDKKTYAGIVTSVGEHGIRVNGEKWFPFGDAKWFELPPMPDPEFRIKRQQNLGLDPK